MLREVARYAVRGAFALGAAVAVFYAGALLLAAVYFAREESRWCEVYVYDYGASAMVVDLYAQPPLGVWGWLALSALVVAAWAVVVWGWWVIARAFVGARQVDASIFSWIKPARVMVRILVWGIAVLSAYALAVFLYDWVEWKHWLDAGLPLPGDPIPGPNPPFNPRQVLWGIVTFSSISALAVIAGGKLITREKA
jgi:peptidoglycan biosynthesis protein MviN/MurJ (putative lipid II flippase)